MNDKAIQDLKQFIAATVSQEFSGLKEDVSELKDDMKKVKSDLKSLAHRIDDMDAKLDTVIEASGEQLDDHENRISKLEAKTA